MNTREYFASFLLIVILILPFAFVKDSLAFLQSIVHESNGWGMALYVLLLAGAVVVPFFNFPAFILAGALWYPLIAAMLGILGWSLGAAIVFYISRTVKKPLLQKFISLNKIEEYEKRISHVEKFWSIIFLRIFVPVDVLSYALGFFTSVPFTRYMFATVIGVTPFAIIFSYGGYTFAQGKYFVFITVIGLALCALIFGSALVRKQKIGM
ncbi:MAG: TVP38/TMEM64 family protein [Candidatus Yonathbacteria bacterium]|nr:TVP38/TMEM64 family protein [Candidatus Yonathbacteria bacterium]